MHIRMLKIILRIYNGSVRSESEKEIKSLKIQYQWPPLIVETLLIDFLM